VVATDQNGTPVGQPSCALALELTYVCNQACAYCYNPSRGSTGSREPTAELLLRRVRRLFNAWNVSIVTVTGGEPLRHPVLFPLLDGLLGMGKPVQLITNGTLVTDALAARLATYNLAAVQITLNGPTREMHREHVGRDSFDDALRGATLLVEHGVPVTGCIVVTRRNAAHVAEIIELWQGIGAKQLALSRFSPAGMSLERMRSWLPRRQDLVMAFEQAQPFARAGLPISCTVPVPACLLDQTQFAPVTFGQCAIGSPYQEFALGPDGALRLCTLHAGRLAGGRDVLDEDWDLSTVMSSPEVRDYRGRLPEFCQGCAAAPSCLGGCGASSIYLSDGAPRALDPLIQQYFSENPSQVPKPGTGDTVRIGADP
jgi:radical SAM protein with 4Fe4S-binding SPASM domain